MENRTIKIKSKTNNNVRINIIPGHFATNHSHVNYYIDMTSLKTSYRMARDAAGELAMAYAHTTHIDTIICLEGTETVGAFLAEKLARVNLKVLGAILVHAGQQVADRDLIDIDRRLVVCHTVVIPVVHLDDDVQLREQV